MKIKQLKIKNIASLKGNHVINFDEILNDLNLFAITGPTGSGKSTILSCIGLVLYGDHYKKSLAQSDFVTLGESKGKIDLYFHFQNREYLAKWEAAIRKKNGEPLKLPKIKRTLFVKDNDEFVPIEKNIQDIIHLNFDQFCKTVILNQGEFSKFLTSNFRERKEILEKLYQGHYLELVGQKLKEELSLEQQKMEVLDSEIQAFKLSATEDITSLKIESQQKSKQAPFIEKLSSLSERIQKALFDIWDNKQKEQKTTNILQKISYDLKEQTNEHGRIKTNLDSIEKEYEIFQNSFLQKRPLYQECLVKKNLYQEKEKELLKTQQKLEQYFQNKEKISYELSKLQNDKLEQKKLEKNNSQLFALGHLDIKQIEELQNLNEKYREILNQKENTKQLISISMEALSKNEKNLLEKESKLREVQQDSLMSDQMARTLEDLDVLQMKMIKQKDLFQEFQLKSAQAKSTQNKYNELKTQSEFIIESLKNDIEELKKLNLQTDVFELKVEKLQLAQAITKCREHWKKSNQCPTCLSQVEWKPDIENFINSENELDLQEYEELKKQTSQLQQKVSNQEQKQSYLATELKTCYQELLQFKKYYNIKQDTMSLEATIEELSQNYLKEINRIQSNIDLRTKLEQKVSLKIQETEQVTQEINLLKIEIEDQKNKLKKQIQYRTDFDEMLLAIEIEIVSMIQCSPFKISYPDFLKKQFQLQKKLTHINHEIQYIETQLKSAQLRDMEIHSQLVESKNNQKEAKLEIANLKEIIFKEIGNQNPEALLDKLHKEHETQKKKLDLIKQKVAQSQLYIKELETKEFQQQEQLKQLAVTQSMAIDHTKLYAQEIKQLLEELPSSFPNNELSKLVRNFDEKSELNLNPEILATFYESTKELFQSVEKSIKDFENRFVEVSTLIERFDNVQKIIKQKELEKLKLNKHLERLKNLYGLIGKDEFRNFVLSHIEDLLIAQTNVELEALCQGRYQLVQLKRKTQIPEFYVIDKLQGHEERKVSTLSGGETFMVSLAMALALSELTRGQTDIDSFFIDEGFGTLDRDSLEDVIDMLNTMRNRGKQIGIISHLEHLTQRLPINIQLEKNQWGHSQIQVTYQ